MKIFEISCTVCYSNILPHWSNTAAAMPIDKDKFYVSNLYSSNIKVKRDKKEERKRERVRERESKREREREREQERERVRERESKRERVRERESKRERVRERE